MKNKINTSIKNALIVIELLFLCFVITVYIFKDSLNTLIYPINVTFFMLITFISIIFLGYQRNKKSRIKHKISNIYIVNSTLYLITIYLVGNATGFLKNDFNVLNTIYLIVIMILMEILRYNVLNKCTKNTSDQYIITFLYILLDILILSSFSPNSLPQAGYLASIIILSIIKNSILSYTTYKYGYYPSMIYTFILTIFPLTAPIYPMLGNYLTLVFTIIYSSIIFYNISKPVRKEDEETANNYKKSPSYYIERFLLVFIIIIIMLVSNNFKFSLTAIASDSMYPYIKKGDAVLIDKISDKQKEKLKEKDVIAFQEDGNVITHRIIKIEKDKENTYYITKGDNNSTKDVTKKTKDDIIGIVRIKIPLLGYPSVEISEIKNK